MKPRHKRAMFIVTGLAALGAATALILNAFQENLVFFFSPTDVISKKAPVEKTFRLGGLVKEGSVIRENDGLTVSFIVTDTAENVRVNYKGILPDLFREGQGIVAQGRLGSDGTFKASEVLAKHDENYMPPEVAEALEKAGKSASATMNNGI